MPRKRSSDTPPVYEQISNDLKARIESGELGADSRLPTIKELAAHYKVSAVTVLRGMNLLKEAGLITTTWGGGTYVSPAKGPRPLETIVTLIVSRDNELELDPAVLGYWNRMYAPIVLGVQQETARLGIRNQNIFLPESLLRQPAALADYLRGQLAQAQGALCLWAGLTVAMAEALQDALPCPVIFNDMALGVLSEYDCIQVDMKANARRVVEHLAELGHRRIGAIAGPEPENIHYLSRIEAWREALAARGLPCGAELVFPSEDRHASIAEACARLLDLPQAERPTAVFCFNDYRALTLLELAAARGVRVPEELAVAGFDGTPQALQAGLTTVQLPFHHMGRMAVHLLESIVSGELCRPVRQRLSTGLIVGRTTAGDQTNGASHR